jgi:hypothetical protein
MTRNTVIGGLLLPLLLGCNGLIADATGPRSSTGETTDPPFDPSVCETAAPSVGETPLRRLTNAQFRATVRAALGLETLPEDVTRRLDEIPDGRAGGFASTTDAPTPEVLGRYVDIAEDLAAAWMARRGSDACSASDIACARAELTALGPRLFRRPLESSTQRDELEDYVGIWDALRPDVGAEAALETAVAAMLASPSFIYHAEPVVVDAAVGALVPLEPFALANRLAFLVWQAPPDDALMDAAAAGQLGDAAGVETTVRRMIADARFGRTLDTFFADWLGLAELEGLESADEAFTEELRAELRNETLGFVRHVVVNGDARLDTLLTAPFTVGTAEVAALYGAPPPDADGIIELDASERAGLLTHASFLAQFGVVYPEVHRGLWVRNNLLCDAPPPPPPDVPPAGAAERLSTDPCQGCHVRMDPIGFAFAEYDALGRFRPAAAPELPVEPAVHSPDGSLPEDLVGPISGPRELAERLAGSGHVSACVATQWYRYAAGRQETAADGCAVLDMGARFAESGGDLRELVVTIATSEAFRFRSVDDLSL